MLVFLSEFYINFPFYLFFIFVIEFNCVRFSSLIYSYLTRIRAARCDDFLILCFKPHIVRSKPCFFLLFLTFFWIKILHTQFNNKIMIFTVKKPYTIPQLVCGSFSCHIYIYVPLVSSYCFCFFCIFLRSFYRFKFN